VESVGQFSSGPGREVGEIAEEQADYTILEGFIR
jgi:hypothetical protein